MEKLINISDVIASAKMVSTQDDIDKIMEFYSKYDLTIGHFNFDILYLLKKYHYYIHVNEDNSKVLFVFLKQDEYPHILFNHYPIYLNTLGQFDGKVSYRMGAELAMEDEYPMEFGTTHELLEMYPNANALNSSTGYGDYIYQWNPLFDREHERMVESLERISNTSKIRVEQHTLETLDYVGLLACMRTVRPLAPLYEELPDFVFDNIEYLKNIPHLFTILYMDDKPAGYSISYLANKKTVIISERLATKKHNGYKLLAKLHFDDLDWWHNNYAIKNKQEPLFFNYGGWDGVTEQQKEELLPVRINRRNYKLGLKRG